VALRYISSYGSVSGLANLESDAKSFLGMFYFPLAYFFWFPSYLAGSEDISLIADGLTLALFNVVGDTADPTNMFVKLLFVQVPTALNII
jgi:hypothetical protein